jgi:hypothetical protein
MAKLSRKSFLGSIVGAATFPRPWHSAALYGSDWSPYHREPVTFDGVDCCVYVDVFDDGEIRVVLIPEDEDESDRWPLDVLALPKWQQEEILRQLRDG